MRIDSIIGDVKVPIAMNSFQKLSVFFLRIIGSILASVGVVGLIFLLILWSMGMPTIEYSGARLIASIVWAVAGIALVAFSKPLGRFLGGGLD